MGANCSMCQKKQQSSKKDELPEIVPQEDYKSKLDHFVKGFNKDCGEYLCQYEMDLFLAYLCEVRNESGVRKENRKPEHKTDLDQNQFEIFVDNKLMNNPILVVLMDSEDEISKGKYTAFVKNLYVKLIKKFIFLQKKNNEHYEDINSLSKRNLFTIGLTFCKSLNRNKIETIFELFAVDGKLTSTKELREFLFLLFSLNSSILLASISDYYDSVEKIPEETYNNLMDEYNSEHIMKFTDNFLSKIFSPINNLTCDQFVTTIASNAWICTEEGIRAKIEEFSKNSSNNH